MTLPRTVPVHDLALAIEAAVALEIETHPHRLLSLAEAAAEVLPSLADDLRRKARQSVRLRLMLARASAISSRSGSEGSTCRHHT